MSICSKIINIVSSRLQSGDFRPKMGVKSTKKRLLKIGNFLKFPVYGNIYILRPFWTFFDADVVDKYFDHLAV